MTETEKPAPARRPFVLALLALPIAGVALGQRFVVPGASIADLTLGATIVLGLAYFAYEARRSGWPRLPDWTRWLLPFWAWGVAGGIVHIVTETETFSAEEFWKSAAKLTFYAVAALVMALVIKAAPSEAPVRMVLNAFAVAGGVAIVVYLAMLIKLPLPYQLLWAHGADAAYYSDLWWYGGTHEARQVFLRAQGLASEPSRLGYLQGMALAYLWLKPGSRVRFGLRVALILFSLLLSFSLTAYIFMTPIAALAIYERWRSGRIRLQRRALLVAGALVLVLLPAAPVAYTTVAVRAMRSFSGAGDSSSFLRLQGNWTITYYLLETSPVMGVGLGNFDIVAYNLRAFIFQGYYIGKDTQGWNVLAYVLATMGVPGLLLLLGMLASAFRGRGWLCVPFFLSMFADGTLLGAAYWLFLALYATEGEG